MSIDLVNPIVVDFETYYDDDYSLSKVTTEQYIREDRFECIGLAIKDGIKPTTFYRGETWIQDLKNLIDADPNRVVVSHNATFDMGILGLRYGIHPKYMADTVAMATLTGLGRVAGGVSLNKLSKKFQDLGYNLPSKGTYVADMKGVHEYDMSSHEWEAYGNYCITDVDITYILYTELCKQCPVDEIKMIGETIKMFASPIIELNTKTLEDYAERLENARVENLQDIGKRFGFATLDMTEKALRSRTKFCELLNKSGAETPMKYSEKQDKMVPALAKKDEQFLELLNHKNPVVRQLVEAKLGAGNTQDKSRTERFLSIASRGAMPIPLYYYAAHTGRYGGSDKINLQNLPKRQGDLSLRRSMCAPTGYAVVATDSSQVEARLLAYAANEQYMVDIFISRRCPYSDMAGKIYNMSYDEIYDTAKVHKTPEGVTRRNVGKATVLGAGYGMGKDRFESEMNLQGLTEAAEMAEQIIATYRKSNPNIKRLWDTGQKAIEIMANGGSMSFGGAKEDMFYADGGSVFWGKKIPSVRLPNGTYLYYQGLRQIPSTESWTGFEYVYDRPNKSGRGTSQYRIYGGKLIENLIQALAFGVLKWQALQIVEHGVPIHLNVHDEWVSVVPAKDLKRTCLVHAKCMRSVPDYIPDGLLDCEVDVGRNYADTKTIEGL